MSFTSVRINDVAWSSPCPVTSKYHFFSTFRSLISSFQMVSPSFQVQPIPRYSSLDACFQCSNVCCPSLSFMRCQEPRSQEKLASFELFEASMAGFEKALKTKKVKRVNKVLILGVLVDFPKIRIYVNYALLYPIL